MTGAGLLADRGLLLLGCFWTLVALVVLALGVAAVVISRRELR